MDRLRSGPLRTPLHPVEPPREPWDLKLLRWLFKTPGHKPRPLPRTSVKPKAVTPEPSEGPRPSTWKPVLGVLTLFAGLAFATHLIQNAENNQALGAAKRWLAKKGFPGTQPSLEMVQDLTGFPSWSGPATRAVGPYSGMILDRQSFELYWKVLNPGLPLPEVDLEERALALILSETGLEGGKQFRFLRAEDYSDRTVLWYDETPVKAVPGVAVYRSWVLQVVPRPGEGPVLIQKVP
jgi:hypothetical protein